MKPRLLEELGENETVLSYVLQNSDGGTQPLPSKWTTYNFEDSIEEPSSPYVIDDTFEDDGKGFLFLFLFPSHL